MITGFNTDIEHDGVVYHVQTEDKGLETPIILSLVYVGGAILASKRAPYEDLIAEGFSDEALADRLKRQHRLICAAINSGRIDDLKRMSARTSELMQPELVHSPAPSEPEVVHTPEPRDPEVVPIPEPSEPEVVTSAETTVEEEFKANVESTISTSPAEYETEFEFEDIPSQIWVPPEKVEPPPKPPEEEFLAATDSTYRESQDYSGFEPVELTQGLSILLLDDSEFYSGESRTLRVLVVDRWGDQEKPLNSVAVSIKILGTTFRPLIYSLKTDRDGIASVTTQIPHFTSGRAAVLVRAVTKEQAAELRRVIHPSE